MPLYEELLALGLSMGDDVKACPCKTIVPFYRKHVFAQIKPTTITRIDFGLALKITPGRVGLPTRAALRRRTGSRTASRSCRRQTLMMR
ncbi:MAG: hypothetical protein IPF82_03880 [Blastocatellia bacterium]|nr:hypothetical protein [Blastocatellia bacterium]